MNKKTWRIIGRFALLILIQLLVLNQVYLGSYVMPMLYLLAILMLPTDTDSWRTSDDFHPQHL